MLPRNRSLQRRLTITFVVIVVVPLAIAGYVVQHFVSGEIQRRAVESLSPALNANVQRYNERIRALPELVQAAVARPSLARLIRKQDDAGLESFLQRSLAKAGELDYLVVRSRGRVLASAKRPPSFAPGVATPSVAQLASPGGGGGFVTAVVPARVVGKGTVASVAGGFWLDDSFLVSSLPGPVNLSIASGDRVIASTHRLGHPVTAHIPAHGVFDIDIGGTSKARALPLAGSPMAVVASTPTGPLTARSHELLISLLILLGVALVGTVAFAYLLARLITRPLGELSEGAQAIIEGRFDHRIAVRSRDEIGQLAMAFNEMTERLDEAFTELQTSRDQLRRAVQRVGDTLRSTHDMHQMMESIINTAADAVESDASVMWTFNPTRDRLLPLLTRGIEGELAVRVPYGRGIIGTVAQSGRGLVLPTPDGKDAGVGPAPGEPRFPNLVAVPLSGQDQVTGVLALYRRTGRRPFAAQDIETVSFLAEQGGVAIENVLLHEEAQRLSLTDGLTGLWNRRYFEMQFRQMLATAIRFDRPFSILMLDLDHFKRVNDTYGHQVGDTVLIEIAHRVRGVIREIDTFARYGGEEFICLLAETDRPGAVITAEKIRETIRNEPMGLERRDIRMTVSIGVASYPEHGDSFATLVEAADDALYTAKQEGRDRVRQAGSDPVGRVRSAP